MTDVDPMALRQAFGSYLTGVTVVTALANNGEPVGFTANSFTSVSMEPPLLLVCPGRHLSSFDAFQNCTNFAVSILAEGQEDISNIFANSKSSRFDTVAWSVDKNGVPIIDGASAHFSCSVHNQMDAGDHCILVGEISGFATRETPGLGYGQGGYFSLAKERLAQTVPTTDQSTVVGVIIEHNEAVYAQEAGGRFALPTIKLSANVGAISAIEKRMKDLNISSSIDCVYSVFDEPVSGERFIYFRAKLDGPPKADTQKKFLPIADATTVSWQSKAVATMMARHQNEYTNNRFGFYFGDSDAGEVHHENQA